MLSIPVWNFRKGDDWFSNLLGRCIVYFTGYPHTHVGIYYFGKLYDKTIWRDENGRLRSGVRVTKIGDPSVNPPDFCMAPSRSKLTPDMLYRIGSILEEYVEAGRGYNLFKLAVLSFVWPTRWIWRKLKWVPFQNEMFGTVCSTFVDRVMKKADWDLFPDEWESYTVPGRFVYLVGWLPRECTPGGEVNENRSDDIGD